MKCKFRSRSNPVSSVDRLKENGTEWKFISVEVKNNTQVDGKIAYVIEALDLMNDERKSLVVDATIINDQDVDQLRKCLTKHGIRVSR